MQNATGSETGFAKRPKEVKFIYSHARLPLRVQIHDHDTTNSIIASVKTFFGIHEGLGVSFEDEQGYNIIPQYENVRADTDIRVRLTQEIQPVPQVLGHFAAGITSPAAPSPAMASPAKSISAGPWMSMVPSAHSSRPASRNAKSGDLSPDPARKRLGSKGGRQVKTYDADGYSDSDAGSVSVTSSRRDVLASADISVENIVEGNRRKGAKFESSQAFPSPISHAYSDKNSTFSSNGLSNGRDSYLRSSGGHQASRLSGGSHSGILPTPAPTIGSALSDEDVALQLMRLGNPNNAPPIRPSASTADDALSGKAELASSADYSEGEDEDLPHHTPQAGPARKKLRALNTAIASGDLYSSGEDYEDYQDGSFKGESDEIIPPFGTKRPKPKAGKVGKSRSASESTRSAPKVSTSKNRPAGAPGAVIPPSPYSASGPPSKGSMSQLASDEEDLSAKPRCQRCRKSKKGCDRQRPCGRCKDAGIGVEGCVSEDEGNGRKGRFGRHMGVSVKKVSLDSSNTAESAHSPTAVGEPFPLADASKKRKR
ncbi:MAG: hypothetical protein Q9159_003523 [Coniocarpon cinnabarinum]